jgi:hypothetical protein
MKNIIIFLLLLLVCSVAQSQYSYYSYQASKETTAIQTFSGRLEGLIIGDVGKATTITFYDASTYVDSATFAGATVIAKIKTDTLSQPVSFKFGNEGVIFYKGLMVGISGTTSGKYTIIYR